MNKTAIFIIAAIIIVAGAVWTVSSYRQKPETGTSSLAVCPESWIENREPGGGPAAANQYYILKGQRREITEFDAEWVSENCQLEKGVVY